ncbi:PREDICTED: uncharacterized protein LOC106750918 isoform X2 [Dinoponera quadriceps]|uniref:Uncharacterized protein LOC106750918 isoform X2 n=1 Tax=Dinoponera quadriceps TaxID=609295 RepID=A0A6P3Y7Q0_DINQU|nr:PREDICTED: uncharacterized protein LOC106750918 isoform X2 [Dinoponera quadriceps]
MVLNRNDKRKKKEGDLVDLMEPLSESPKRTKVHAQRKFAQGASTSAFNTSPTPAKDKEKVKPPQVTELITHKRPNTEDFLTFLCFRGTSILPPSLNFFNYSTTKNNLTPRSSRSVPVHTPIDKLLSTAADAAPGTSKQETCQKNVTKVKPVVPVKKKIPSTIHKSISKLKTATSTVQALKKKYQEQRLAKQRIENKLKATCVMRTRSCTERTTLSSEVKLPPEKYLPRIETKRHGLRSGLLLDKTSKLLPKTKDAPAKPKRRVNLRSRNSDTSNTDESSEEEEDDEEGNEVDESQSEKATQSQVKRNVQKSIQKKICTRSKSDLRRVTRSYSGTISPKNLSTRPTRKTKEAAAVYMEILGRKLVSPEIENDDNVSVESFPELPNARKVTQTESDVKAKATTKQTTAGRTVGRSKDLKAADSDNGNKRLDKSNTDKVIQLKSKRIIRVQRYCEEDSEEESESSVEMSNTRPITRQSLGKLEKSADRSVSRSLRSSSKNTPVPPEEPSVPSNKPKVPVQSCAKPAGEKPSVVKRKRDQSVPKTSSSANGPKPKSLKIEQNEDAESEEETLGMLLSKMKKKKESNEEKEQVAEDIVVDTKDDAATKPGEAQSTKMDLSKVSDDEESFRGFTKKAISKVLDSCQTHANVNLLVGEKLSYAKMLDMTEAEQGASSQKPKEEVPLVNADVSVASLPNDERGNRVSVPKPKSTIDSSHKTTHDSSSSTGQTSKKCNHEDEVSPDLMEMPLSALPHTRKERVNMSTERIEKWLNESSLAKEESKLEMENVSIFRYDSGEKLKTDVSHLSIPTKIQHLVRPVNVTLSKLMDKTSLKDRLKMLNKSAILLKPDTVHTGEAGKPPAIVSATKNSVYTDAKPSVSPVEDNDPGGNKVCADAKPATSIEDSKTCVDAKPSTSPVEENDAGKGKTCTEARPSTSSLASEEKDTGKSKLVCTEAKPGVSLAEETRDDTASKLDPKEESPAERRKEEEKKSSTEKKIFQPRKPFLPKVKERKTVTPNANAFSPENESSVYAFESDTEVPISTPFRRKVRETAKSITNKPVVRSIVTLSSINKPAVGQIMTYNPKPTAVVPAVTSTVTSAAASTSRSAMVSTVESTVAFTRTSTVTSTVVSTVASVVISTVTSTVTSTSKADETGKPIVKESPPSSISEQSTSTIEAPALKSQEITAEPITVADTALDLNKFNLGMANIQVLPLNKLMTNWSNDSSSIAVQVNLGKSKQEQQTETDRQEKEKQGNDRQGKDKQGKEKPGKDKPKKEPSQQQQKSTEISTQTETSNDEEEQLFYIPLQAITRSGPNLQRRQVIQGVAVKLGTEGRVGSNQRVLLRAKLVTKSPLSIAHHPTPVGTVQPTTRAPPSSAPGEEENVSSTTPSFVKMAATTSASVAIASVATTSLAPAKMTTTVSTKVTTTTTMTTPVVATTSSVEAARPVSPAKSDVSNSTRSSVNMYNSLEKLRRSPKSSRERKASVDSAKSGKRAKYKLKGSESSSASNNTTYSNIKDAYDEYSFVPQAPTFRPSEKEFLDPMEYINKIRPTAERFGICKVVPPANFKPECKVSDDMRFTAYNQYVHRMLYRWGPNVKELMAIKKYLATQSITLSHPPWIGGMEVDLPHLYQTVQSLGGLKEVIEKKKWQKVADGMKIPKSAQDRVTKLDDIYCKYLLPYDTLSPEEREKLFNEVEEEWLKKESKALERQETSSTDNDEEEEEDESSDEIEECIVKGRNMPLNAFYRIARNTQRMWFGENQRGGNNETEGASALEVESAFWRHVVERKRHVCVHAASIDSSGRGFGFPVAKNSPFARHSWNLKVLTNNAGSVLRALGPVMGVTVPTLHVGMLFSACCWYRDPHGLPWIEYLHTGAKKIWYGIPDEHNNNFREALSKMVPQYCKNKTIWLPSDTAMVPPKLLIDNDVPLCQTVQEPGQFIIVFPKAFTSSICTGYVVSESVYFAQPSWLETAEQVFKDIQDSCEPSIFSFERLLFNIINDPRYTQLDILKQILPSVLRIHNRELEYRKQLEDLGLNKKERVPLPGRKKKKKGKKVKEDDDDYECETCRANLFVSIVTNTQEDTFYCLPHALELLNRKKQLLKHCVLMYTYNEGVDLLTNARFLKACTRSQQQRD